MVSLNINPSRSESDMTTKEKVARRKLSLLELAADLGNVSKACKVMVYSRQQFYEIRRNFQTYGADGLIDRLPGARGQHPNRVSAEIEKAVLDHALEHPCHGPMRVAQQLMLQGIQVSSGGVRGLAAPRPADQARAPAAPGEDHGETPADPVRRADPPAGAVQPGGPRAPHRSALHHHLDCRRHLLRGHP